MADTRLLDFDGYLDMIEKARDAYDDEDEDAHFVIGTHAPRRDWGDMVHDFAQINGLHGLRQLAEDPDQALDEHAVDDPSMWHDRPELRSTQGGKFIGDAGFPRAGFADPDTTDDVEHADRTLITTTMYPERAVSPSHPHVLDVDGFKAAARAVLEQYDPGEHAVFVGAFAPNGSFSIQNDGPIHRTGDAAYPANAFANTTGIGSLNSGNTSYYGTIVIAREHLSSDAIDMLETDDPEPIEPDQGDQGDGVEA